MALPLDTSVQKTASLSCTVAKEQPGAGYVTRVGEGNAADWGPVVRERWEAGREENLNP